MLNNVQEFILTFALNIYVIKNVDCWFLNDPKKAFGDESLNTLLKEVT